MHSARVLLIHVSIIFSECERIFLESITASEYYNHFISGSLIILFYYSITTFCSLRPSRASRSRSLCYLLFIRRQVCRYLYLYLYLGLADRSHYQLIGMA